MFDRLGDDCMRGGIGLIENDQKIDIGEGVDGIASHGAPIETAGIEIITQALAHRSHRLVQGKLEFIDHASQHSSFRPRTGQAKIQKRKSDFVLDALRSI
jgi:hypothetical protein